MSVKNSKPGKPVAPAAYRPQPVPKVLQRKVAGPAVSKPAAPPVYRPQSTPVVLQRKVRPELQPRSLQKAPFQHKPVTAQQGKTAITPRAIPTVAQRKTMATPRGRQFGGVVQRAAVEVKAPAIRWSFTGVPARVEATLQEMAAQVPDFRKLCESVQMLHGGVFVKGEPPVKGGSIARWEYGAVWVHNNLDHDDMVNCVAFELTNGIYAEAHKKVDEGKDESVKPRHTEYIEYQGVLIQSPIIKAAKAAGLVEKERWPNPWGSFDEYLKDQEASGHTARYRKGGGGGSKCFITSACVYARGLTDDCDELTTLRAFRDNYIMNVPGGPELIREYYEVAPGIVDRILESKESEHILGSLYEELVVPSVRLIHDGEYQEALTHYRTWVVTLINDWRCADGNASLYGSDVAVQLWRGAEFARGPARQ